MYVSHSTSSAQDSLLFRLKFIKVVSSEFLFSQTNYCAHRTISFLSFHTFFIVHRSVLTAENLMEVKAQKSFKKFHL